MSDAFWNNLPAILIALATIPTSLAGVIISLRNGRKVEEVHKATNSMKDALVAAALKEGHAAGIEEQKQAEVAKDRRSTDP